MLQLGGQHWLEAWVDGKLEVSRVESRNVADVALGAGLPLAGDCRRKAVGNGRKASRPSRFGPSRIFTGD